MVVGTTNLNPHDGVRSDASREVGVTLNIEGVCTRPEAVVVVEVEGDFAEVGDDTNVGIVGLISRDVGWVVDDDAILAGGGRILPFPSERRLHSGFRLFRLSCRCAINITSPVAVAAANLNPDNGVSLLFETGREVGVRSDVEDSCARPAAIVVVEVEGDVTVVSVEADVDIVGLTVR